MPLIVYQWNPQDERPFSALHHQTQKCLMFVEWMNNQLVMNGKALGSIHFLFPCSQLFMSQTYKSALLGRDKDGTVPPWAPLSLAPNHSHTWIRTELNCLSWAFIDRIVSNPHRGHLIFTSWKYSGILISFSSISLKLILEGKIRNEKENVRDEGALQAKMLEMRTLGPKEEKGLPRYLRAPWYHFRRTKLGCLGGSVG